jgi:SAM-dependent methyltransferase
MGSRKNVKLKLRLVHEFVLLMGIDPIKFVGFVRGLPRYLRELRQFKDLNRDSDSKFAFGRLYPCMSERNTQSGTARGHYFHQDLLVARKIFVNKPVRHVDVGSRMDGFVAHVASFRAIEVLDVRPMDQVIENVKFVQCDLMNDLPETLIDYCDSLSCLHALEHFGLGRYGDPLRADGHKAGIGNLTRMLQAGGRLYISVPVGPQRIEFNAHRVFSIPYFLDLLEPAFDVESFSLVDDRGDVHANLSLQSAEVSRNFGCEYGCGIFELIKRKQVGQ